MRIPIIAVLITLGIIASWLHSHAGAYDQCEHRYSHATCVLVLQ